MLNLLMVPKDVEFKIVKIRDKKLDKERHERHLTNLGFVEGSTIKVVSENNGNLIVKVKDSRVGIGKDVAQAIIVQEIRE